MHNSDDLVQDCAISIAFMHWWYRFPLVIDLTLFEINLKFIAMSPYFCILKHKVKHEVVGYSRSNGDLWVFPQTTLLAYKQLQCSNSTIIVHRNTGPCIMALSIDYITKQCTVIIIRMHWYVLTVHHSFSWWLGPEQTTSRDVNQQWPKSMTWVCITKLQYVEVFSLKRLGNLLSDGCVWNFGSFQWFYCEKLRGVGARSETRSSAYDILASPQVPNSPTWIQHRGAFRINPTPGS